MRQAMRAGRIQRPATRFGHLFTKWQFLTGKNGKFKVLGIRLPATALKLPRSCQSRRTDA